MKRKWLCFLPIVLALLFLLGVEQLHEADRTRTTGHVSKAEIESIDGQEIPTAKQPSSTVILPMESKGPIKTIIPFRSSRRFSFSSKIKIVSGTDLLQVVRSVSDYEIEIVPLTENATGIVTVVTEDNRNYMLDVSVK